MCSSNDIDEYYVNVNNIWALHQNKNFLPENNIQGICTIENVNGAHKFFPIQGILHYKTRLLSDDISIVTQCHYTVVLAILIITCPGGIKQLFCYLPSLCVSADVVWFWNDLNWITTVHGYQMISTWLSLFTMWYFDMNIYNWRGLPIDQTLQNQLHALSIFYNIPFNFTCVWYIMIMLCFAYSLIRELKIYI